MPSTAFRAASTPAAGPTRPSCALRRGITLIETLLAVTIAAMASAALLLAVESALSTATDAADRVIADGLAQQLLDEIVQKRYTEPGVAVDSTSFGPEMGETTAGRSGFDDVDDYHNFSATPLVGRYGEALGSGDDSGSLRAENFRLTDSFFGRWRHLVQVYYVDSDTLQPLASGTSAYRCIEVVVEQLDSTNTFVPVSTKRQVIAYVPPAAS